MKWRYGIIKTEKEHLGRKYYFYGIGEIYFDKDPNNPISYSEPRSLSMDFDPSESNEFILKEFEETLKRMQSDCRKYSIYDTTSIVDDE
jgi:hypothetical protein